MLIVIDYEPEAPEFPDCYRQMLIQKLPGIVTEQLIAQGSKLMRHMTNQNASSGLESQQLSRQIENVVKDAVQKTLSQVDGSKEHAEGPQIPLLNIESPEEESKGSVEKENQMKSARPALLHNDLLQPPVSRAGLKLETRAQYPTPTSTAFSRSPEMQFGSAELRVGSTSPLDIDLASMFGGGHLDTPTLMHTTGGTLSEAPGASWDTLTNNTVFSGGMYTPARQNSTSTVCGPAGGQSHDLLMNLHMGTESFLFEHLAVPPQETSVQSNDSGYDSIAGLTGGSCLDSLDFDVDLWADPPFPVPEEDQA